MSKLNTPTRGNSGSSNLDMRRDVNPVWCPWKHCLKFGRVQAHDIHPGDIHDLLDSCQSLKTSEKRIVKRIEFCVMVVGPSGRCSRRKMNRRRIFAHLFGNWSLVTFYLYTFWMRYSWRLKQESDGKWYPNERMCFRKMFGCIGAICNCCLICERKFAFDHQADRWPFSSLKLLIILLLFMALHSLWLKQFSEKDGAF